MVRSKAQEKEYHKQYREAHKDELIKKSKQYYKSNKDKISVQRKQYYEANKDKISVQRKQYHEANKDKISVQRKQYHEANKDKISVKNKQRRAGLKKQVYDAYGNKCACCDEDEPHFLSIDHVQEIGTAGRKKERKEMEIYRKIIGLGFPQDYRILCHNCNFARSNFGNEGVCPHQRKLECDVAMVKKIICEGVV